MPSRLPDLLDDAVARGLITTAQRTQLLALAEAGDDHSRGRVGEFLAWTREVPRGFNAISIAYAIGALIVVFALGWFLADRWSVLGPTGVLIVSVVYAALFAAAAHLFTRERFATAHGLALLLLILTVPLITWAFLRTTGVWVDVAPAVCSAEPDLFWACRGQTMILAATAFVASVVAMRRLAFGPLMIPGAGALLIVLGEATLRIAGHGELPGMTGWSFVVVASMLVTIAYETDRRRGMEDYGRWLHVAAVIATAIALSALFSGDASLRYLLLPTAVVMMASSLYLRRVIWLFVGLIALFSSLLWMAREVFKQAVAFPVLLGFVGITVILVTVLIQRQYPRLAERVRGTHGMGPHFPGGAAVLLLPALVAVLLFPLTRVEAVWAREWAAADQRRYAIIAKRDAPPPRRRGLSDAVPVRPIVRDSLADSVRTDSIPPDSLRPDSLPVDTVRVDTIATDALAARREKPGRRGARTVR
jgi:hypothetical protein